MLSITSICISRVMLGIRSLAAELISDPALLLNNAELSRVFLKRGTNTGEFIVNVHDDDSRQFGVLDIRRESGFILDVKMDKDSISTVDTVLQIGSPV
jgi:hypothetical protein